MSNMPSTYSDSLILLSGSTIIGGVYLIFLQVLKNFIYSKPPGRRMVKNLRKILSKGVNFDTHAKTT